MSSTAMTNWDRMTPEQRLTAAMVDIMQHKEFALLSGVLMMGNAVIVDDIPMAILVGGVPTAGTDGLDCLYGKEFMSMQDRAQHRWIVLHENFHKALHHCTDYVDIVQKYPKESNMAQDFVINATIDEMDPQQQFAKRPSEIQICLHKKYYGWSWIEVLRDILKNGPPPPPQDGEGEGEGGGSGKTGEGKGKGKWSDKWQVFDAHIQNAKAKNPTQANAKELEKIKRDIQDALYQGKLTVEKMAGKGKGTSSLDNLTRKRTTDWKTPLRMFIEQIVAGYDNSRFCPPSHRFLPLGIVMPSHFSESTGELHVYCDTSGSMAGVYPVVFGEIARIAEHVKPSKLRVIWWDDGIHSEQVFTEKDFGMIATLMKPGGGGGTSPSCVVRYVTEKGYKPKAGIWLTDGYLDGSDATLPFPVLWGVVDNEHFVPPQGAKIDIQSAL